MSGSGLSAVCARYAESCSKVKTSLIPMALRMNIKNDICALFEAYQDEHGVLRVVTPLEYSGTSDRVIVRVRPSASGFRIDDNGEAAFLASLAGGDMGARPVQRWIEDLRGTSSVSWEDETLIAQVNDERLVAPYIFSVAEAAQQLYVLATALPEKSMRNVIVGSSACSRQKYASYVAMKNQADQPDDDNPEWTDETTARADRIDDLPQSLQDKLRRAVHPHNAPTPDATTKNPRH